MKKLLFIVPLLCLLCAGTTEAQQCAQCIAPQGVQAKTATPVYVYPAQPAYQPSYQQARPLRPLRQARPLKRIKYGIKGLFRGCR